MGGAGRGEAVGGAAHLAEQGRHDAVALLDEGDEDVLGVELGVVAAGGLPVRFGERFAFFPIGKIIFEAG